LKIKLKPLASAFILSWLSLVQFILVALYAALQRYTRVYKKTRRPLNAN